jgi:hypothetical protein
VQVVRPVRPFPYLISITIFPVFSSLLGKKSDFKSFNRNMPHHPHHLLFSEGKMVRGSLCYVAPTAWSGHCCPMVNKASRSNFNRHHRSPSWRGYGWYCGLVAVIK